VIDVGRDFRCPSESPGVPCSLLESPPVRENEEHYEAREGSLRRVVPTAAEAYLASGRTNVLNARSKDGLGTPLTIDWPAA